MMRKFNVFLFVHWHDDYSDPPEVRWITVVAKSMDAVKKPTRYHGFFVSAYTVHPCGGAEEPARS